MNDTAMTSGAALGSEPREVPDLVIAGGNVVDPSVGLSGEWDIAIRRDRISAIGRGLGARYPDRALDVSGALVLPGLVDLHTHCFWDGTYFGIRPDPVAGRCGVTTWVDAGSAGAWNLAAFRKLAETSQARIRAYINVSAVGLVARTGELDNIDYWSQNDLDAVVADHRDFIVGVKVRMGHPKHGIKPLERAVAAGDRLGLPVMVHVRNGPPNIRQVLDILRKGDILTHCYTDADMALVDGGRWLDEAYKARERGVLFDVGHGGASFGWKSAEYGFAGGFQPDIVSSDLHQCNYCPPNVDLPQSMSKMLHLGMSLPDVVRAATSTPAAAAGLTEVGSLQQGAPADIAVFDLEAGSFEMGDTVGETRTVERCFRHVLTLSAGKVLPCDVFDAPAPYLDVPSPVIAGARNRLDKDRIPTGVRILCDCC